MGNPPLLRLHLVLLFVGKVIGSFDPLHQMQDASVEKIIRQYNGDVFVAKATHCDLDTCIGLSSGTATSNGDLGDRLTAAGACTCQCHPHLPTFRDDLHICVDDIHECVLASFASGSTAQQIPFVYLPLKGQIIHPSKEISFAGIKTPVCAVSSAKFMTENGWADLRDPKDSDVPFRMFRDEGRTFLQWVGEQRLRDQMSGRLVLVHLMCREIDPSNSEINPIFSPCVAFRIVGTPAKHVNSMNEVSFSSEEEAQIETGNLSTSEYVAVGISSVLLGLIYVASVLLYLHLRKARESKNKRLRNGEERDVSTVEEGVIKNNPLLGFSRHFGRIDSSMTLVDSGGSDGEMHLDNGGRRHDDMEIKTTSVIVHPTEKFDRSLKCSKLSEMNYSDPSSTERLPEENVSIVETIEGREERPETVKSITGTTRRKLYFNPAYFEPQLLLAPPPAAVEFLTKIREVITMAKQKMASKRFTPNLMGIPEEESSHSGDVALSNPGRRSSLVSLKRENSRRRSCTGCPGCEALKLPELQSFTACSNCKNQSKEETIQRWLDNIPMSRAGFDKHRRSSSPKSVDSGKKRAQSERGYSPERDVMESQRVCKAPSENGVVHGRIRRRRRRKAKAPSPPLPAPDMITDVLEGGKANDQSQSQSVLIPKNKKCEEEVQIDTITRKNMRTVISEFSKHHSDLRHGYEIDSLERCGRYKGWSTPPDYGEVPSLQSSPSMSAALPMEEEMTTRNAVFNLETGNRTMSKLSTLKDEHDYELIVLRKDDYLAKLWQKNGYNLVSEVYVNNGYNYNSTTTSNSSTLERQEVPGKLLIRVEDCPDNYIRADESDNFEPDTLDRKPRKMSFSRCQDQNDHFSRSNHILLKSTGSFKISSQTQHEAETTSNFKRNFGSLREIYEAKLRNNRLQSTIIPYDQTPSTPTKTSVSLPATLEETNRLLTLEERHAKRQRTVQPDVIPPPPHDSLYERPKPPRKYIPSSKNSCGSTVQSPCDPCGAPGGQKGSVHKQTVVQLHDAGYLSLGGGSETDDNSIGDAHSESGAESVETHSVFFGDFRKIGGSVDSGIGWDVRRAGLRFLEGGESGSESESYGTVVSRMEAVKTE